MSQKKYTLKELCDLLKPEQLGYNSQHNILLYRPEFIGDPRVEALITETGWSSISNIYGVIRAYPTLENSNMLWETGLRINPTDKFLSWHAAAIGKISPYAEAVQSSNSALFDYQKDGAEFLTQHDRAMLSLSPGLGKTLTSAYAAGLRDFDNVLVVCPASLLYYWKGELEKWQKSLPKPIYTSIWHRKIGGAGFRDPFILQNQFWAITNPETVSKHLNGFLSIHFDCLIVDESIMYKHRDSQRSKAMKSLAQSIDVCWMLTGAPASRFLDDMWHQFHILKPKGYSSYWRFTEKYCIVDAGDWGSKIVANQRNAEKEIKKNFADIYFSRTQDDVANIPDWIMEDVDIPMPVKQDKAYETLRKELYVRLESIDPTEVITVTNHLSLMVRSVQVASNPLLLGGVDSAGKWEALPELMEIYPGPSIVWVHFIKTGEILRDRFGKAGMRVALANGATPMLDRTLMVDGFQRGELDVIILNDQVGKFGFTLTKARTAFFLERAYDDSYFQCLHRNRRIGTEVSPVIVNMRSVTQSGDKTIDHLIHSTLDYRVGMIKKVTAGDLKKVFEKK
jgi:SNF2 family DNA or RNA helicase